jgi:glycosyltransferase involved in cell wall biosynthesis
MRLLMFTRYTAMAANSRYRLFQYIPMFEAAGHQVEVRPMLDDAYLNVLYSSGRRSLAHTLRGYARRLVQLQKLSHYDAVICDQEFLPYFPAAAEREIARRCPRLFVDYDDAAHFKYRRLGPLRHRIPQLMSAAEAVVVGNHWLADFARLHNRNVHIIPTVVNCARYAPKQGHASSDRLKLVWIGTPVTAMFLEPLANTLATLREKYSHVDIRLIGAGARGREILPFAEVVPWSEATEAEMLSACDIGLMPLPDNDFTRGKCGLKLIQYMAAGLPVVASPVGANCDIVSDGSDGFLADTPQQWFAAIERLILSPELRRDFARSGVAKVAERYSLQSGFNAWMRILEPHRYTEADTAHQAVIAAGS